MMRLIITSLIAALIAMSLWSAPSFASARLDSINKISGKFNYAARDFKPRPAQPAPRQVPIKAPAPSMGGGGRNIDVVTLKKPLPPPPVLTKQFNKVAK